MKRLRLSLCLLVIVACATGGGHQGRGGGTYRVVHGWPMLPTNELLDEVSAVAADSHEHVFVLTRGGRLWPDSGPPDSSAIDAPTVTMIDGPSGRILATWPNGLFALPHSITVDDHDNVWVTDVAWHQVFKFSHDGKLLLTLGERGVPGKDAKHFNEPSDVAVAPDGSVFVSDGYGNNRVAEFSPQGKFLREWGKRGSGAGELDLPHAIALDAARRVYVVDRNNNRIEIFDSAGGFVAHWPEGTFSSAQDVKVGRDGRVFIASAGRSGPIDSTGVVVLDSTGHFLQKVGGFGNYDGQFIDLHWVAVSRSGALYTADFEGRRVQKFVQSVGRLPTLSAGRVSSR